MSTNRFFRTSAVAASALLSLLTMQSAVSQHVHGVIELGIVVEDGAIAVSLSAPLSDVVGFEHAPENDEQTERLEAAAGLLSDADAMFSLPGQAACTLKELTLDAPSYLLALRESHGDHDSHSEDGADHADEAHDEHHHDSGHDHEGESERAAAHSDHDEHDHDSDHDHDDESVAVNDDHADHDGHADADHDHDHEEHGDHDAGHAEIDARYVWACGESSELNALGTPFVKEFASVETINIQIITPAAARVVEADQTLETIGLSGS